MRCLRHNSALSGSRTGSLKIPFFYLKKILNMQQNPEYLSKRDHFLKIWPLLSLFSKLKKKIKIFWKIHKIVEIFFKNLIFFSRFCRNFKKISIILIKDENRLRYGHLCKKWSFLDKYFGFYCIFSIFLTKKTGFLSFRCRSHWDRSFAGDNSIFTVLILYTLL